MSDTTRPVVKITSPLNGANITGSVLWVVDATDNVKMHSVSYFIDGKTFAMQAQPPYQVSLPTVSLSNGPHKLLALGKDSSGNTARHEITITTSNPDTTGPTVTILNPLTGATVSGVIDYKVRATDANGVNRVDFYVDNIIVGSDSTAEFDPAVNKNALYRMNWNSASVANGSHVLMAKGLDFTNNVGTRSITINVSNAGSPPPPPPSDTTPPSLTISSPTNGQTMTGPSNSVTFTVTGTTSDATLVEVQVDGGAYSAATGTTSWSKSVTISSTGSHTVNVRAKDVAGNTALKSFTLTDTASFIVSM